MFQRKVAANRGRILKEVMQMKAFMQVVVLMIMGCSYMDRKPENAYLDETRQQEEDYTDTKYQSIGRPQTEAYPF